VPNGEARERRRACSARRGSAARTRCDDGCGKPFKVAVRPAILKGEVPPLGVLARHQALSQGLDRRDGTSVWAQHPHAMTQLRHLRPGGERGGENGTYDQDQDDGAWRRRAGIGPRGRLAGTDGLATRARRVAWPLRGRHRHESPREVDRTCHAGDGIPSMRPMPHAKARRAHRGRGEPLWQSRVTGGMRSSLRPPGRGGALAGSLLPMPKDCQGDSETAYGGSTHGTCRHRQVGRVPSNGLPESTGPPLAVRPATRHSASGCRCVARGVGRAAPATRLAARCPLFTFGNTPRLLL
jgi:hypothetical protein